MQITATAMVNGTSYTGTFTRVQPKRFEDLSLEKQAYVLAHRAEQEAKISAHLQKISTAEQQAAADAKGHEVWNRRAPNVSSLTREQALDQIAFMSELIQSGEADTLPLVAAKGTQTTNNYRQYVYWAQQHVKDLDGAGESVPQQAGTGTAGGPFPADYVSEIKKLRTDVPGVKYEDWSPEFKQRVAEAHRRSEAGLQSDREMVESAKLETVENNVLYAPNVATLSRDHALRQIERMTDLIQSGEAEKTRLQTGYGDRTTNNYRQYVYWLQQHVQELDAAQPVASSNPYPAEASSGWKRITESVKYEDLSPEQKARWALDDARVAEADRIAAEMEQRSKLETVESNSYCAPYVQGLSREQALTQIYFASEVIRNGQEEKYTLSTSLDGKQTTSNFRQYVYWLQQHVKELDGAGQSTLAQA
jgi:hypothetical protein